MAELKFSQLFAPIFNKTAGREELAYILLRGSEAFGFAFLTRSKLTVGGTHFLVYTRSRTENESIKYHDSRVIMTR